MTDPFFHFSYYQFANLGKYWITHYHDDPDVVDLYLEIINKRNRIRRNHNIKIYGCWPRTGRNRTFAFYQYESEGYNTLCLLSQKLSPIPRLACKLAFDTGLLKITSAYANQKCTFTEMKA